LKYALGLTIAFADRRVVDGDAAERLQWRRGVQSILRQNIAGLQKRLAENADERECRALRALLASAERDLALVNAELCGVSDGALQPVLGPLTRGHQDISQFQRDFERSSLSYIVLDPRPGLHIVDINDAYAKSTMTVRSKIAGQAVFDVFPDNPKDPSADGVSKVYGSLQTAAQSGVAQYMPLQRYDVRNPDKQFVTRYWRTQITPLFDGEGCLSYLLCHAEDVTEKLIAR
jgi:PAS domain-containing protein